MPVAPNDRTIRFSKIRAKLGYPKAQKPSPHQILTQMLMDEQALNLAVTNTRQPSNLLPAVTLTTVAGQSEYSISQIISGGQFAGKAYFVIRETGEEELPYVPVPFDDFNQLDYGKMPAGVNSAAIAGFVPEKISFYLTGGIQGQTRKAVIQPAPQEVLHYKIYFHTGGVDPLEAAISEQKPLLEELTDYIDLRSLVSLLPLCEWQGNTKQEDREQRKDFAAGFAFELQRLEPIVDEYIDQINQPVTGEMSLWNE